VLVSATNASSAFEMLRDAAAFAVNLLAASQQHVADRFNQVKDNWAFLVEEHTASKRLGLYRRLFGDITDIKAQFADFSHQNSTEFEDSGLVQFRFKNGGMGCINYSTAVWDKNFESSITIIGSKGTVKIGGQYMNEVEYCHIQDYTMPELPPANPANDYGPYKGSAANHNYIFDNVINSLNGGEFPTTNALEGLKVVEIIENIYAQNPYFRLKFKDA
jgi:predicted dehydrogenase